MRPRRICPHEVWSVSRAGVFRKNTLPKKGRIVPETRRFELHNETCNVWTRLSASRARVLRFARRILLVPEFQGEPRRPPPLFFELSRYAHTASRPVSTHSQTRHILGAFVFAHRACRCGAHQFFSDDLPCVPLCAQRRGPERERERESLHPSHERSRVLSGSRGKHARGPFGVVLREVSLQVSLRQTRPRGAHEGSSLSLSLCFGFFSAKAGATLGGARRRRSRRIRPECCPCVQRPLEFR